MRLIDADRLKSYIDCGHLRPPTEVCFSELDVCNMIDKAPTVSAEAEQVTGKLKNPCDSLLISDSDECKEQKSKLDLISRQDAIEAIEEITWYHQNRNREMVSGANSTEDQAWYKSQDIYAALEALPSVEAIHKPDYSYEAGMVRRLKEALSAEAVEVVRCKDCKWHMNDYMGEWCGKLSGHPGMKAYDFCSYGERRD